MSEIVSSYEQLKEFFTTLDQEQEKTIVDDRRLSLHSRAVIGSFLLTRSIQSIDSFSTNRYFLQSIGVDEIPMSSDINIPGVIQEISQRFGLSGQFSEDFLDESLAQLLSSLVRKLQWDGTAKAKVDGLWGDREKGLFSDDGFILISEFFDPVDADLYRDEIYRLAEFELNEGRAFRYGFENSAQRVYNLINKTDLFDNLLSDSRLETILRDIFHRETFHQLYTMSSWHANILYPDARAQKLHADAAVPEPLPSWIIRANVSFVVEDHTVENGATLLAPRSHKLLRHPGSTDRTDDVNMVPVVAKKGSIIIWNGHLWHQSGANLSQTPRAALLACYCASHLLEMALEENHPLVISSERKHKMSDKLRKLFALEHGIK
jgi:hypothetical protein